MSNYRHNHYVPEWYQRRFMLPGQARYWRLDLYPEEIKGTPTKKFRKDLHEWSPENIFATDDLYTTRWGEVTNTEIEQFFFGKLDASGPAALDFFSNFRYDEFPESVFKHLLTYMSVQKMRTPKGLAELDAFSRSEHRNLTLLLLQQIRSRYCAIWTEAIWQIADASNSPTKFIISDHPVTVYNRACPPLSKHCRGHDDPDIRMNATHTYFPLSLDKVLIFTNLSWLRNPYQNELSFRPNPMMFRQAMFSFLSIQTGRLLAEDEVLQINLVTKRRAYRYIAAAEKEWLYPERRVSTDHWRKLGDGMLFMPEPRLEFMGGEILIGYKNGASDAFNAYGQKPWQKGYKDADRERREAEALERFKAEWATKWGPKYTAFNMEFGGRVRDTSPETMDHYKKVAAKYKRKR